MYGSTTKGDVVKRSDCTLVYGSTTKGDVAKRSDCTLVYGSTTKGDVVKRFNCTYNMVNWNVPIHSVSTMTMISIETLYCSIRQQEKESMNYVKYELN